MPEASVNVMREFGVEGVNGNERRLLDMCIDGSMCGGEICTLSLNVQICIQYIV